MTEAEVVRRWQSLSQNEREAARLTGKGFCESEIAVKLRCEADETHRMIQRACSALEAEDSLGLALRILHYRLDAGPDRPSAPDAEDAVSPTRIEPPTC